MSGEDAKYWTEQFPSVTEERNLSHIPANFFEEPDTLQLDHTALDDFLRLGKHRWANYELCRLTHNWRDPLIVVAKISCTPKILLKDSKEVEAAVWKEGWLYLEQVVEYNGGDEPKVEWL